MSDYKDYEDDGLLDEEQEGISQAEDREIADDDDDDDDEHEVSGGYNEDDYERDQRQIPSTTADDDDYDWHASETVKVDPKRLKEFKDLYRSHQGRDWFGGTQGMAPATATRFLKAINGKGSLQKNLAAFAKEEQDRESIRQITGRRPWTT
ncbi:hypothetical protein [Cohnella yongneupensis]|uniref:Uncharacterized protein n=1 Tax=Cohnella yongneupensis TaxID=425006 RepID=A0ABW0R4X9_9BACL